jgi:biopolymer transport protein ExbD
VQFKRQKDAEVSVNLTPLIDVVFLLLIFFMVSTTFTKETHLSLDLPEAEGEQRTEQPQQIEILIDSNGQYAINQRSLASSSSKVLMVALKQVSDGNVELPLVITADAKTPHQAVITAMDAAGQLGFAHLSLTTKKPASE